MRDSNPQPDPGALAPLAKMSVRNLPSLAQLPNRASSDDFEDFDDGMAPVNDEKDDEGKYRKESAYLDNCTFLFMRADNVKIYRDHTNRNYRGVKNGLYKIDQEKTGYIAEEMGYGSEWRKEKGEVED